MRYTRISADCHIDMPWLPPDLFTANASALMKDRMPYVVEGPDGLQWTTKKGAPFGLVGGIGSTGTKYVPGQNHRVDVMASTGLYDDGKKGIRRPGDPHLRVTDMDRDGVQAEVLFGILGAATRLGDHEAAGEMFRIYNDWLVEFCKHYPDRHIALPACRTATSTRPSRRSTAWHGSDSGAWNCRAPGTWSPCGTRCGSRSGRP